MQYFRDFLPRYSLSARMSDFTDTFTVQFFRSQAETLLGVSAQEFIALPPASQAYLLTEKWRYINFAMEIHASYNHENRLIYTCKAIFASNQLPVVNTYLLDMLAEYEDDLGGFNSHSRSKDNDSQVNIQNEVYDYGEYMQESSASVGWKK